jgi:hypothetical protein
MRRYGDCRDGHRRGDRGRGALGPATPTRPGSLGATPATDVGTATSPTASLYPVPSLLTDR